MVGCNKDVQVATHLCGLVYVLQISLWTGQSFIQVSTHHWFRQGKATGGVSLARSPFVKQQAGTMLFLYKQRSAASSLLGDRTIHSVIFIILEARPPKEPLFSLKNKRNSKSTDTNPCPLRNECVCVCARVLTSDTLFQLEVIRNNSQ
jgi:hypothetical protein